MLAVKIVNSGVFWKVKVFPNSDDRSVFFEQCSPFKGLGSIEMYVGIGEGLVHRRGSFHPVIFRKIRLRTNCGLHQQGESKE